MIIYVFYISPKICYSHAATPYEYDQGMLEIGTQQIWLVFVGYLYVY